MEKAMTTVPAHRVPKSVGFLGAGCGGWLQNVAQIILVDNKGAPHLQGATKLLEWGTNMSQPYQNGSLGWIYRDEDGKMGMVVYFLTKEAEAVKYQKTSHDALVGRDPLIPFAFYQEYSTGYKVLAFDTPGGPPIEPPVPVVKATEGGSDTYKSRF